MKLTEVFGEKLSWSVEKIIKVKGAVLKM